LKSAEIHSYDLRMTVFVGAKFLFAWILNPYRAAFVLLAKGVARWFG